MDFHIACCYATIKNSLQPATFDHQMMQHNSATRQAVVKPKFLTTECASNHRDACLHLTSSFIVLQDQEKCLEAISNKWNKVVYSDGDALRCDVCASRCAHTEICILTHTFQLK